MRRSALKREHSAVSKAMARNCVASIEAGYGHLTSEDMYALAKQEPHNALAVEYVALRARYASLASKAEALLGPMWWAHI